MGRKEVDADRDGVVIKLASPILYTICLSDDDDDDIITKPLRS